MGFWDWLFNILDWLGLRNKTGKLLLLGLDNAGKTTLLQRLTTGNFMQFDQTKSYHVEDLSIEGIHFSAYDLGGHEHARESWSEFFANVSAVVFMVDIAAPDRFAEAKKELDKLLSEEDMRSVPFLILANKVDLPGARSPNEIAATLGIFNQTAENVSSVQPGTRAIRVFPCSVKEKIGYAEGFRWLSKFL